MNASKGNQQLCLGKGYLPNAEGQFISRLVMQLGAISNCMNIRVGLYLGQGLLALTFMPSACVRPLRIIRERPTMNRSRGKCCIGMDFIIASSANGHTSASGSGLPSSPIGYVGLAARDATIKLLKQRRMPAGALRVLIVILNT